MGVTVPIALISSGMERRSTVATSTGTTGCGRGASLWQAASASGKASEASSAGWRTVKTLVESP